MLLNTSLCFIYLTLMKKKIAFKSFEIMKFILFKRKYETNRTIFTSKKIKKKRKSHYIESTFHEKIQKKIRKIN